MRRILFVSRHYASDFSIKVGGIFQRMRMMLEGACRVADVVDVLFFVDQRMIDEVRPEVARESLRRDWGIDANIFFAPRASMRHGPLLQTLHAMIDYRAQEDYFRLNGITQRAAVRSHVRVDTDLIVAHRLYAGSVVVAAMGGRRPIVMDLDDIEHRKRERLPDSSGASATSRVHRLEVPALKRGELAALRACATSFVCSQADRDYLIDEGIANTTVVPNAVRFGEAVDIGASTDPATLFFIGTYGYRPNADAAEYLINAIFPIVRAQRPDAKLLIAGETVERLPSFASRPDGVEFAGFSPDLVAFYRRATVVCCPVLAGGGTRIKIIEAAAACKAVVSTTIGAEGLDFDDGHEILLRDSPATFARACLELFDDRERAATLGRAANRKARVLYERDDVLERVVHAFARHAQPMQ